MTKTEIDNKIYDLKRTIKSCENVIKANENEIKKLEAEKERPAFERAERGKKYYFVDVYRGKFFAKHEVDEHSILDNEIYASNNYFHTKERAEEVTDKINFLLKLERLHDTFCPDYKPGWEDKERECYWYVKFDSRTKRYEALWSYYKVATTTYFDSRETANKVCEILNEEELENEDM